MTKSNYPFSQKINVDRLGDATKAVAVAPDAAELAAIAAAYGVVGITSLRADLKLSPWHKAGVRVRGTLTAAVEQRCVVTLDLFTQDLEEQIDRTFEPASSRPKRARDLNDDGEIEIDLETLDPPDVILDGVLDLGGVVCEHLALCLDPFPRKPGVEFAPPTDGPDAEDEEPAPSPFAVLAGLKPEGKA